jgi:hypothetical protein
MHGGDTIMSDSNQPNKNPYADAMWGAYEELKKIKVQKRELTIREAQLTKTVNALYPIVFPETPDINTMSLPDAIRLIIAGCDRPLSAYDMRTKLEDLGFDLAKFENPLANIHTAMNRMSESGELVHVDGDKKRVEAGPNLKPPPETPSNWEATLPQIQAGMMPEGSIHTPPAAPSKKSGQ